VKEANDIYNQVGVNINSYTVKKDTFNYNSIIEDGLLHVEEQFEIQRTYFNSANTNLAILFVINDISDDVINETTKGRAILGSRKVILDDDIVSGQVIAHELGHALWFLYHPEDEHGAGKDGYPVDSTNLMHNQADPFHTQLRHYQISKMTNHKLW
jgi:hypothetical protein